MADYITVANLRLYIGDTSTNDPAMLAAAVTAASRRIESLCGRYFTQDASVSDKYFDPNNSYYLDLVDPDGQRWDLSTTTGLIVAVDMQYTGTYGTTLVNGTDFSLNPINGSKYGLTGWPYQSLSALVNSGAIFPLRTPGFNPTVRITGKWGWAAIPTDVVQACYVLAKDVYLESKNVGGFIGFESGAVRVRENPAAMALLEPFMLMSRLVA